MWTRRRVRVPVRLQARKTFIESTRKQITTLRDEVQAHAQQSTTGFSTKAATKSGLPSIGKSKGYGKLGVQEEPIPPADDDIIDVENGAAPAANSGGTGTADEILGAELDAELLAPPPGRHRKKKACLALIILLLLVGAASASLLASGSQQAPASTSPAAAATANDGARSRRLSLPAAAAATAAANAAAVPPQVHLEPSRPLRTAAAQRSHGAL